MCRFLLSEKTSYHFKKYFHQSQETDWSQQSLVTASRRSRSLQPKFSRWQQLNSLVAERHEGEQQTTHSSLAIQPTVNILHQNVSWVKKLTKVPKFLKSRIEYGRILSVLFRPDSMTRPTSVTASSSGLLGPPLVWGRKSDRRLMMFFFQFLQVGHCEKIAMMK